MGGGGGEGAQEGWGGGGGAWKEEGREGEESPTIAAKPCQCLTFSERFIKMHQRCTDDREPGTP